MTPSPASSLGRLLSGQALTPAATISFIEQVAPDA
jgi:hypothetical protein